MKQRLLVLLKGLTSQLSVDALERQLPELVYQSSELTAADQLMFAVVQLVHRNQPVGQNSLHQHTVPAAKQMESY